MESLPEELVHLVIRDLSARDIAALLGSCKALRRWDKFALWTQVALLHFSPTFWAKAFLRQRRPAFVNFKHELKKLHAFETAMQKRFKVKWREADYVQYWQWLDFSSSARPDRYDDLSATCELRGICAAAFPIFVALEGEMMHRVPTEGSKGGCTK